MTTTLAPTDAAAAAVFAWSKRVRRIGGFIQVAFAAFWLVRGSLNLRGPLATTLAVLFAAVTIAVVASGIRAAGWVLIVGPVVLVALLSGTALTATTGIAAGIVLLGIATAGFHDLATGMPSRTDISRPAIASGDRS